MYKFEEPVYVIRPLLLSIENHLRSQKEFNDFSRLLIFN
jgi:hypothetical protein